VIRHVGQVNFIIECKNVSGNIWVFSEEKEQDVVTIPEHVSLTESLNKDDPTRKTIPTWPIHNIPYVAGYEEFVFDKNKSNRNDKNPKNLYSAISSVTKAASFEKLKIKKTMDLMRHWTPSVQNFIIYFMFIQPLIIFSGKMFVAKFNNNDLTFKEVEFVQMKKDYVSNEYDEGLGEIHIIHEDKLNEYMQSAMQYYSVGSKYILDNQSQFRKAKNNLK